MRREKRICQDPGSALIDDVDEEQNDTLTALFTTTRAGIARRRDELLG
ncbi:hypothetical protein [Hymenobacter jeollabukensis]|nr:hypothetical protein [Hymenobacter jeollabukensis]